MDIASSFHQSLRLPALMMASQSCWRCLSRPNPLQLPITRLPSTTVSFSSASQRLAVVAAKRPTKGGAAGVGKRPDAKKAKTLNIKKKAVVKTGKPPAPGERKAIRKRIVLSNTNAFEVEGMRTFNSELLAEMVGGAEQSTEQLVSEDGEKKKPLVGSVVALDGLVVDSLRGVEAFKTTQGWEFFRKPAILVREESVALSKMMVEAEDKSESLKLVIDGAKGTGKSLMLIHAMATAFLRRWIVINIPEAQELVNASSEYAPIPNTNPRLWSQNTYVANLLSRIYKANSLVLDGIQVAKEHSLPIPLQANISLSRLCELGARDPDIAWPVYQAFWKEITLEGRPPILFAVDSLSFIMQNSAYRNVEHQLIHAHDLAFVRHFIELMSDPASLPNGGAVLGATSGSHAPVSPSLQICVEQAMARSTGSKYPQKEPYGKKYDARTEVALQNIDALQVKGLSKVEARGLMEYWAQSGVLRQTINEKEVSEKWALAGNGIVGEIERNALRMRI